MKCVNKTDHMHDIDHSASCTFVTRFKKMCIVYTSAADFEYLEIYKTSMNGI